MGFRVSYFLIMIHAFWLGCGKVSCLAWVPSLCIAQPIIRKQMARQNEPTVSLSRSFAPLSRPVQSRLGLKCWESVSLLSILLPQPLQERLPTSLPMARRFGCLLMLLWVVLPIYLLDSWVSVFSSLWLKPGLVLSVLKLIRRPILIGIILM